MHGMTSGSAETETGNVIARINGNNMWLSPGNSQPKFHSKISKSRLNAINNYIRINRQREDWDALQIVFTISSHPHVIVRYDENIVPIWVDVCPG
jgi:arginine deiminase